MLVNQLQSILCAQRVGSSTPSGMTYDIELTVTTIPNESDAPQLVELHLMEAPSALWDTVRRWVGDQVTQERNRAIIEQMVNPQRRVCDRLFAERLAEAKTAMLSSPPAEED